MFLPKSSGSKSLNANIVFLIFKGPLVLVCLGCLQLALLGGGDAWQAGRSAISAYADQAFNALLNSKYKQKSQLLAELVAAIAF